MKKPELGRRMRQEIRGMIRLSPLLVVSLLAIAVLWRTDSAATSGLYQSSPVETPVILTSTATAEVSTTETSLPTSTVLASPTVTGTVVTATAVPLETPTDVPPTETAWPTATLAPTEELPLAETPVATAPGETAGPEAEADGNVRYPEGESTLRFEWGMLFDSLALLFSYVWLCGGILLFIAVPVFFFLLWRSSSTRQEASQQEEGEQDEGQQVEGLQKED